ncbi:MAG: helix-turn-helix transcriptional regulator [Acidobacteriota bacterium]
MSSSPSIVTQTLPDGTERKIRVLPQRTFQTKRIDTPPPPVVKHTTPPDFDAVLERSEAPPPLNKPVRYITKKAVLERAGGISKSTWHDWLNPRSPRYDSTAPRPVNLSITGKGVVRWIEEEVDLWLASKAKTSRK